MAAFCAPAWDPATLGKVTDAQVQDYFAPLGKELPI